MQREQVGSLGANGGNFKIRLELIGDSTDNSMAPTQDQVMLIKYGQLYSGIMILTDFYKKCYSIKIKLKLLEK